MSISTSLRDAVTALRSHLQDPTALIAVLAPSSANGVLAQQQLALAGPMIRVVFLTAEQVVRQRAEPVLHAQGLRTEPPGWLGSTLRRWLDTQPDELAPFAETLSREGWADPLTQVVERLDEAGVGSTNLTQPGDQARVLRAVLTFVEAQRTASTLVNTWQLGQASLAGAAPVDQVQGVVLLGQRRLAPYVRAGLVPWLQTRPSVLIDLGLPPTEGLPSPILTLTAKQSPKWVLAATPDPVRECREAVRAVLDAVSDGVPLDRIAIAMPDLSQVEILRAHLEDARLPARFMVGAPLAKQPAAQLLRLAHEVHTQPTLERWHRLLTFPRLRLAYNAGAQATVGRARWRRLLSQCGGTGRTVLAALGAMTLDAEDEDARSSLVLSIDRLQHAMRDWDQDGPLATHAERWRTFLEDWFGRRSQEVIEALAPLEGPSMSNAQARRELDGALGQRAPVRGIQGRAVLVAEPMGLLGGAFDRVMLLSAVEGSLPRQAHEDPLLPDALATALATKGHDLETTRDRAVREQRRFRAVLSAACEELWVSIPKVEMLEGRPLLPSSLLLDALGCSYSELRSRSQPWGSRARATTATPDRAVDATESLLARPPSDRAAALLTHPAARRLMAYQQAVARVSAGGLPCPWTGRIDSRPLPPTTPTPPGSLGWNLVDLGGALLGHVGARDLRSLAEGSDPTDRSSQARLRLEAVRWLWDHPSSTLNDAIDAVLDEATRYRPVAEARLNLARHLLRASTHPIARKPPAVSNQALPGLHVAGELGWVDPQGLTVEVSSVRWEPTLGAVLQAWALKPSPPYTPLRLVDPEGKEKRGGIDKMVEVLQGRIESADKHYYPFIQSSRHALPDDPQIPSDELTDRVRRLP